MRTLRPVDTREIWKRYFEIPEVNLILFNILDTEQKRRTLQIDFFDLDKHSQDLTMNLLDKPEQNLELARQALKELIPNEQYLPEIELQIQKLPESFKIPIREIRAEHLNKLISIEGLVRKVTEVRPKLVEGIFECVRCTAQSRLHQDTFEFQEPLECNREDPSVYTDRPGCGRASSTTRFKFVEEESSFADTQKIELQEFPEGLRGGQQPERIVVYLEKNLAGKISAGDRVTINGIIKTRQKKKSTFFDIHMNALSIEISEKDFEEVKISEEDELEIKNLATKPDVFDMIVKTIAPSIYGLETEKQALALQLFGGVRKELEDNTKIRGDIHILLIGDPGTAKSQLLDYVSRLAPRGVFASGKGTTGAGLTAAAVRDDFGEGRWTLEAGAFVLADMGALMLDEIEKISEDDRGAIHDAMEQQRIIFNKAGINTTLQTRCSVLAAGNPKLGRFDDALPLPQQINLPPSLLSRFDAIFLTTDKPNVDTDTKMSKHILDTHLDGQKDRRNENNKKENNLIKPELLRKYIAYAKRSCFPIMTQEAYDLIQENYLEIRGSSDGDSGAIAITPRQLEGFVRLSEASARTRLSDDITIDDARRAVGIVKYYLGKVTNDGGVFDIDMIATGRPKSQKDRLATIVSKLRELGAEKENVNIDDLLEGLKEHGFDDKYKLEQDVGLLLKDGSIFHPREGEIRLVR